MAVEASTYSNGRRGVAGTLIAEKILGAAAEAGGDLAALRTLGERVNRATRSIGVALTSCTVPAVGRPTFSVGEDEVEFGVGIHGEPGRRRQAMARADQIVEDMVGAIVADLGSASRGEAIVLVNGFGATPNIELYLVYHEARTLLARHGIQVARPLVGTYVTSLDMAGVSISLALADAEMLALWDAPVHTAALRWRM